MIKTMHIPVSFSLDGRFRRGYLEFNVRELPSRPGMFVVPWSDEAQQMPKSGDSVPHVDFGRIWYKKDGGTTTVSTADRVTEMKWGKII